MTAGAGDFRDAVIDRGNQRKCGCIEIHSLSSNWKAHGHHQDRFYNQVVLHVAMKQDRLEKTILQNGQSIPTVILDKNGLPEVQVGLSGMDLPCRRIGRKTGETEAFLDKAGELRFASKTSRYDQELSHLEAGQVLYQGVLEALGYAKNQIAFFELARRAPLHYMEDILNSSPAENEVLTRSQAFLMGSAGLLPSQTLNYLSGQSMGGCP